MRAHRAEFRVTTMARVLGVSTSGYYAWLKRPRSARAAADDVLAEWVRAIHARSRGTYGAPRIQAELADEGVLVNRKRVARLMRESGLTGARSERTFRNRAEAKTELFRWIEGWYNPHRHHSALRYLSPVNFENAHYEHREAA